MYAQSPFGPMFSDIPYLEGNSAQSITIVSVVSIYFKSVTVAQNVRLVGSQSCSMSSFASWIQCQPSRKEEIYFVLQLLDFVNLRDTRCKALQVMLMKSCFSLCIVSSLLGSLLLILCPFLNRAQHKESHKKSYIINELQTHV